MRGSVRKRGSTWTATYDEQPGADKRKQRSRGGFATKREAQAFLTDQLRRLDTGTYVEPSRLTVRAFLVDEWLPAITSSVRPATAATYERAVRLDLVPALGAVRLQALRSGHLNGLYAELERGGLAPATIRQVHATIRRACNDAVRWGALIRNPASMADPPRVPGSRARAWTAGELSRFLDVAAGDRLSALWRLAATTAMRRGELLGLTWRAVDFDGARLSVEQQLTPRLELAPPKSERSRRTVALDPKTVDVLRRHREAQMLERAFAGDAYDDRDLVFCDELGLPTYPRRLSEHFHRHRKAAKISTGTMHTLRHTAITLALTSGVPVHIVAARAGDRAEQILSTYAHLLPQSDELAAERVAAALASVG
jgi:integrase